MAGVVIGVKRGVGAGVVEAQVRDAAGQRCNRAGQGGGRCGHGPGLLQGFFFRVSKVTEAVLAN